MPRLQEVTARTIRETRERYSLTQQELARRVGVPRATIANVENQRQNVSLELFLQIATVLDVDPCKLITDEMRAAAREDLMPSLPESLPEKDRERVRSALSDLLP